MGYIVKILPNGFYLISGDYGDILTTKLKEEAIKRGLFEDYSAAAFEAQSYLKAKVINGDYNIEQI